MLEQAGERSTSVVRKVLGAIGRWMLGALILCVILFLFRVPLLKAMGAYLVVEDPLVHADVAYVLGGSAIDRGAEAVRVFREGYVDRFICTGAPVPGDLEVWGLPYTESECTRKVLLDAGIPADHVEALKTGTSTREECTALLARAKVEGTDTVMIISHGFHLRRVRYVFHDVFKRAGITVLLHAAPNKKLGIDDWWRNEQGLLMVYCEYVKLVWYRFT